MPLAVTLLFLAVATALVIVFTRYLRPRPAPTREAAPEKPPPAADDRAA